MSNSLLSWNNSPKIIGRYVVGRRTAIVIERGALDGTYVVKRFHNCLLVGKPIITTYEQAYNEIKVLEDA